MLLGFDLDEVICKTADMAFNYMNNEFESKISTDVLKHFYFDKNTYSTDATLNKAIADCLLWAVFDGRMLSTIEPYEDAVRILQRFRKMGHKIFIITKRELKHEGLTNMWLYKHNVPFDKLIVTDGAHKGVYAKMYNLDCFVDDLYSNLEEMSTYKHRWKKGLMLMTRRWNVDERIDYTKYTRVNSWVDIMRHIEIGNRFKR